jgi:hypothetical protein
MTAVKKQETLEGCQLCRTCCRRQPLAGKGPKRALKA